MQCAEQLRGLADWLSAEAKRRRQRRGPPLGWWEFTEKRPSGRALSTDSTEVPYSPFATASVFPRRPWVLLHIMFGRRVDGASRSTPVGFYVVAYFGRPRGGDVHGRTKAEKQGKRRQFRQALRSPTLQKSLGETMFIDAVTPPTHIAEQLAAFCLRRNTDPDGSLYRFIGLNSSDAVRRQIAEHVVQYFTDPRDPRSYPAYLKLARQRILIPELSGKPIDHEGDSLHESVDWKTSPEESRRWIRPKKSSVVLNEFSVGYAAIKFDVPRRTIYHWIYTGKLRAGIGSHGRLVISIQDMQEAMEEHVINGNSLKRVLRDPIERSNLIAKMAAARGIQRSSARKHINRRIAAGAAIPELQPEDGDAE